MLISGLKLVANALWWLLTLQSTMSRYSNLVEVVLSCVSGEDACHARVETAAENGCQTSLLETLLVSPLPRVLEVSLVLRLVVGGVEVRASASQTSLHDGEVLIGQGEVDDQFRLIVVEESLELLHIVGVHLSGLDVGVADCLDNAVTLRLCAACNHEVGENVSVLRNLERCNCSDAISADHKYFSHCFYFFSLLFFGFTMGFLGFLGFLDFLDFLD